MDHPQLSEVLTRLQTKPDCAVVAPGRGREIMIVGDRNEDDTADVWAVRIGLPDEPSPDVPRRLLDVGLTASSRDYVMPFGPRRGSSVKLFSARGDFPTGEAAARSALSVPALLWGVPVEARLWVTEINQDDRDEAARPPT